MSTEEYKSSKFNEIYEKYKVMVFNTAMTYSNNNYHTALEIVQEVFISCYKLELYLKDDARLGAWLKIATENKSIDYWRKHQFEELNETVSMANPLLDFDSMDDWHIAEEEKAEREMKAHSILEQLRNKNAKWYESMLMYYFLDMKEKMIADKLGTTTNAVKSVTKRARAWIRKHNGIDENT